MGSFLRTFRKISNILGRRPADDAILDGLLPIDGLKLMLNALGCKAEETPVNEEITQVSFLFQGGQFVATAFDWDKTHINILFPCIYSAPMELMPLLLRVANETNGRGLPFHVTVAANEELQEGLMHLYGNFRFAGTAENCFHAFSSYLNGFFAVRKIVSDLADEARENPEYVAMAPSLERMTANTVVASALTELATSTSDVGRFGRFSDSRRLSAAEFVTALGFYARPDVVRVVEMSTAGVATFEGEEAVAYDIFRPFDAGAPTGGVTLHISVRNVPSTASEKPVEAETIIVAMHAVPSATGTDVEVVVTRPALPAAFGGKAAFAPFCSATSTSFVLPLDSAHPTLSHEAALDMTRKACQEIEQSGRLNLAHFGELYGAETAEALLEALDVNRRDLSRLADEMARAMLHRHWLSVVQFGGMLWNELPKADAQAGKQVIGKDTYANVARMLSFAYFMLGNLSAAYFYIDAVVMIGEARAVDLVWSIDILYALGDNRCLALVEQQKERMEAYHRQHPEVGNDADFLAIKRALRRREAQCLVRLGRLEEAEVLLNAMLGEAENTDFAINELENIENLR